MTDEVPDRPKWLDDEFLRTCIRNLHELNNGPDIQIIDVAMSYVVPKGENFMSVMYRAAVTYQLEKGQVLKEPFIVKVSHDMEAMVKSSSLLCDMEIDMYVNYVPELDKIFQQKGLKPQFACRYFHTIDEPKAIVFKDLKPLGFVLADRRVGADLEHSKAVYNKIAQFHAAGMCYLRSQPDSVQAKYIKSGFEVVMEDHLEHVTAQIPKVKANIEELKKHSTKYIKAIDYLTKYIDLLDLNKLPLTPYEPESKFNTLNHTDLHANNIMFRYKEDGTIADLILVDLQTCHYTSVAFDFLFFFFTSTSLEVRKKNYDELKNFYFESLVNYLNLLDYKGDIPTKHEFEENLKRHTISVMFCLTFMLPVLLKKLDSKEKSRENSEAFSMKDVSQMMSSTKEDRNYLDKLLASVDILQHDGFMDKLPEPI